MQQCTSPLQMGYIITQYKRLLGTYIQFYVRENVVFLVYLCLWKEKQMVRSGNISQYITHICPDSNYSQWGEALLI